MMFKKKEKEENIKKKETKKDNEKINQISNTRVSISIFKLISNRTPYEVKSFVAEQIEENDMVMLVNEDENFKEDIGFTKHKKIRELEYALSLKDKDDKKQIEIINSSISKWLDYLKELEEKQDKAPDDKNKNIITISNQHYNKLDIENKIRYLKVLKYTKLNKGEGTHETISQNGMRKLYFVEVDGMYYPYFFNAPSQDGDVVTCYPDIALKKPIYTKSITRAMADYNEETTDRPSKILENIKSIASVIFFITAMVLFVIGYNNALELPEKYGDRCIGYAWATSEIVKEIAISQQELIDYALEHKANESIVPKTTNAPIKPESKIINLATGG